MATRRLLAVLLVMLFLTAVIGALAPVERSGTTSSSSTTSTTTTSGAASQSSTGELLTQRVAVSADRPPRIQAGVGDQLQLVVTAKRQGTIEIPALGEAEDVDPESPARFDLLLETEDTYAVRFLGSDATIAFIDVSVPRSGSDAARG